MNNFELFHEKYPITLLDGVFTVCIARYGWLPLETDLPFPSIKGIKPFIQFCGFSDSALRTALSRERKKNNLIFFSDNNGISRLDMAAYGQGLTRFYQSGMPSGAGLTMAVFQFSTGENKARYTLKEILKGFGFKMLTQNTYISREVPHNEIVKAAEDAGVEESLYLFNTGIPDGKALERIKTIYSVEQVKQKYKEFEKNLERYFNAEGDEESSYNRALYAGAAHHMYNRLILPPLPEHVFPGLKTFLKIDQLIVDFFKRNFEAHKKTYLKYHGG